MPLNDNRKRSHSDLQDTYAGPEEFMEPGVRGFLVSTLPDHEEQALDQAMRMLRKASVKLHGGIKPVKNTTAMFAIGYIALDFVDPDSVTSFPNPDGETQDAEAQPEENIPDKENIADEKESEKTVKEEGDGLETGDKEETQETPKSAPEEERHETEVVEKKEKMDEDAEEKEEHDAEMTEDIPEEEKSEKQEDDEGVKDEKKETSKDDNKKDDKKKENTDKSKSDKEKSKTDDGSKRNRGYKTRREKKATPKWPIMKPIYKFKAFRTEFRNVMFIKSDVPEPMIMAGEIMDLILKQKPLRADAINQLLPVLGICNYDYWELEVMARRVLAPLFSEDKEEAPSFGILVFDKFSDPGADTLTEIIRSAIWSLNPMAWQNNPLGEPDITVQIELIGSKIVLSAMASYMKYRQYAPFCLAELGEGLPEDPENPEIRRPVERERERYESRRSDRRRRSRSPRSKKSEEKSASTEKDKDKSTKSSESDKNKTDKSDSKSKKTDKENLESVEDKEMKDKEESMSKTGETDADVAVTKEEEKTREEEETKNEEETKEEVTPMEEAKEETEDKKEEDKKTPQRRGGRRSSSKRKRT